MLGAALALVAMLPSTLLPLGCARRAEPPPPGTPRLVLFLVVDQMRYDYLERVDPLLTGGLRRLLDEGVLFTDAEHDHAVTNTGPGHATLATGVFPSHSGIVSNGWLDHETREWVYCVGDPRYRTSPANLLVPTLADRIRQRYPEARTFGVSGKDRAAVLMSGWDADGAFWYDWDSGEMTTSAYYREPDWLEGFNDRHLADVWFGRGWEPLPVDPEAARAAGIEDLDEGPFGRSFPHPLGHISLRPDERFYRDLYSSPFLDELVGRFAQTLLVEEGLGRDEVPDFLAVSFSALDTVGHDYGPNSPEVLDVLLRLDRVLGELLDRIDRQVGLDHVLISLAADHGVVPLPELRRLHGLPGWRLDTETLDCIQQAGRDLSERLGVDPWLEESMTLDPEVLEEHDLDRAEVLREAQRLLGRCPRIVRVWTSPELENAPADGGEASGGDAEGSPSEAETARLYRHSYYPGRSPDLYLQLGEYAVGMFGWETNHGSVYPYDRHVPLIVRVPGGSPGRVSEPVRTVDLAPTLADLLGLPKPEGLDGVSLRGRLEPDRPPP